jgi:bifunctional DNA-binding transcriptional regulator/antitoxin component of YhaV-PrlF toxin-antitoxin module
MQTVSIIRNRGQLTIPDSIRKAIKWLNPLSAVVISVNSADEIVITPHNQIIDYDAIWKKIERSRAIVGKGKGSASQFLQKDRNAHTI